MAQQTPARIALTLVEAAAASGLSRASIYREIGARRLKVVKIGRRTLVRPADLEAWINAAQLAGGGS